MTELKVDWCDHKAATYAVMHWHYSKAMPSGKLVKVGVWEDVRFIGAVLFGRGGNNNIGAAYNLKQVEICELVRVALTTHAAPVSQIVTQAIKMLHSASPGVRCIVSYADPKHDHHGGIYQAMNWIYVGSSRPQKELFVDGKFMHKRSASARWGTASPERIKKLSPRLNVEYAPLEWKHTYLYPLDRAMRRQIAPLAKPYPKRDICGPSVESDTTGNQPEGAGATPAGRSMIEATP